MNNPQSTLLLSPHDSTADTLRPRLDAMGANPNLIHLLPNFHSLVPCKQMDDEQSERSNPLRYLADICRSIPNLALLIIDPITHFLGLTDKAAAPDTRSTLHALAQLAESLNIAILLTTRLTKKLPSLSAPSLPNLHRTLGSLAFATAARTTLLILPYTPAAPSSPLETRNSTLETPPNRLLLTLKSNITSLPPPLPFSLGHTLTFHPELDPAFFTPKPKPTPERDSMLLLACEFLRGFLADGPKSAAAIQRAAGSNGIALATLRRAKLHLRLLVRFDGGRHAWFWALQGDLRTLPSPIEEMRNEMSTLSTLLAGTSISCDKGLL